MVDASDRKQFAYLLKSYLQFPPSNERANTFTSAERWLLGSTWSAIPSRRYSSVVKYWPLTLAEYPIDLASSSTALRASTELMSGLGAPARTAMPIEERATGECPSAKTKPSSMN